MEITPLEYIRLRKRENFEKREDELIDLMLKREGIVQEMNSIRGTDWVKENALVLEWGKLNYEYNKLKNELRGTYREIRALYPGYKSVVNFARIKFKKKVKVDKVVKLEAI